MYGSLDLVYFQHCPNKCIYQARAALLAASPQNKESLSTIESAAIIIALDNSRPVTREEISWGMWVGDGRNRFYDKHQCAFLAFPISCNQ